MGSSTNGESKSKKFNLRATPRQEELIRVAAKHRGLDVTDFIIESACEKAERTLANQAHLALDQSQGDSVKSLFDTSQRILEERYQLIAEKFEGGLSGEKLKRLGTLDERLGEMEIRQADEIDRAYRETVPGRLDSSLDRLERYIDTLSSRAR